MIEEVKFRSYLEKRAKYLFLLLFIAVSFVCAITHEPWADEAQSWMMVTERLKPGSNAPSLLGGVVYEGHPIVYHLYLFLFAGWLPYLLSPLTSWLASCVGMLFLAKSKLDYRLFCLCCICPVFYYWVAAFARSYSLCLAFAGVLCYMYPKRFDRPVVYSIAIAFGMSIHFEFSVVVALLGLCFGIELLSILIKDIKMTGLLYSLKMRSEFYAAGIIMLCGAGFMLVQFLLVDTSVNLVKFQDNFFLNELLMYITSMTFSIGQLSGVFHLIFLVPVLIWIFSFGHDWKTRVFSWASLLMSSFVMFRSGLASVQKASIVFMTGFICLIVCSEGFRVLESSTNKRFRHHSRVKSAGIITLFLFCMLLAVKISPKKALNDLTGEFDPEISSGYYLAEALDPAHPVLVIQGSNFLAAIPILDAAGFDVIMVGNVHDVLYAEWSCSSMAFNDALWALGYEDISTGDYIDIIASREVPKDEWAYCVVYAGNEYLVDYIAEHDPILKTDEYAVISVQSKGSDYLREVTNKYKDKEFRLDIALMELNNNK